MQARISRMLPAAAASVTLITALGASAAAAAPARPATTKAVTGIIFTPDRAGYRAGFATGWRFRWVTTTFPVLNCADTAASHGWTGNGATIGSNGVLWKARIGVGCATNGAGAIVDYQLTNHGVAQPEVPLALTPSAGHNVTVSIYYDRTQGALRFTATDNTTSDSIVRSVSVGAGISYFGAGVASRFNGMISAPPTDVRTGAFSNTHLTSYSVRRSTMLGPWPTSQLVATSTGAADGDVIANAPVLWNGGANFGVWERITAHP